MGIVSPINTWKMNIIKTTIDFNEKKNHIVTITSSFRDSTTRLRIKIHSVIKNTENTLMKYRTDNR